MLISNKKNVIFFFFVNCWNSQNTISYKRLWQSNTVHLRLVFVCFLTCINCVTLVQVQSNLSAPSSAIYHYAIWWLIFIKVTLYEFNVSKAFWGFTLNDYNVGTNSLKRMFKYLRSREIIWQKTSKCKKTLILLMHCLVKTGSLNFNFK